MCRYAQCKYKQQFICFSCRKTFKHNDDYDVRPCPQCKQDMPSIGRDFRPPKLSDKKRWGVLEAYFKKGYTFHSCGCRMGSSQEVPGSIKEVESKPDLHKPIPYKASQILNRCLK